MRGFRARVQRFDDGHQMRHRFFQIVHGPGFQRFRQDGVVRVSAGVRNDIDGFVQLNALCGEQADQLRDHQRGVRIVDLHSHVPVQIPERKAAFAGFL